MSGQNETKMLVTQSPLCEVMLHVYDSQLFIGKTVDKVRIGFVWLQDYSSIAVSFGSCLLMQMCCLVFSMPEQRSRRSVVLPSALA